MNKGILKTGIIVCALILAAAVILGLTGVFDYFPILFFRLMYINE